MTLVCKISQGPYCSTSQWPYCNTSHWPYCNISKWPYCNISQWPYRDIRVLQFIERLHVCMYVVHYMPFGGVSIDNCIVMQVCVYVCCIISLQEHLRSWWCELALFWICLWSKYTFLFIRWCVCMWERERARESEREGERERACREF